MALVSDDLALLDARSRALLDDVIQIGREVDDQTRQGPAPRCEDLLDAPIPTHLRAAGYDLVAEPASAESTLGRPA